MTTSTDVQSLIWLIHAEMATVMNTLANQQSGFGVESIRVRMGQLTDNEDNSETAPQLDVQRYPLAQQGWLLDINYNVHAFDTQPVPAKWKGLKGDIEVIHLQGVGPQLTKRLHKLQIFTIDDLRLMNAELVRDHDLRQHQTMAALALALPPIALTTDILEKSPLWLIDNESWLNTHVSSDNHLRALSTWLRQLEVCLDNKWLSRVSLREIVD